ncbi:MAG: helicase [Planctomycetes bacterium]|nr:helicase [Planctomycetota bacterium]
MIRPDNPIIVQSDRTIMLHTVTSVTDDSGAPAKDEDGRPLTKEHPRFAEARDALAAFAELEKSPDYLHTYRITPVSIWNAAALGVTSKDIEEILEDLSCVPVPSGLIAEIEGWVNRYGELRIERDDTGYILSSRKQAVMEDVLGYKDVAELVDVKDDGTVRVGELDRGTLKQILIKLGYPVDDRGGYLTGDALQVDLCEETSTGKPFELRPYQREAADAFYANGTVAGGNGVVVLPCGAGKTVTAMAVMSLIKEKTLILTTNTVAVRQWKQELLDKTDLTEDQVGEYTGQEKVVRPVTITTYQMLTWRRSKEGEFEHFGVFTNENWGLVVYDEVHLLPAPIFRVTADLQARRRLGLTATLVREDEKEDEVFCLIGPKRYDVPWKVLEGQGFIAHARCVEVRVRLAEEVREKYISADARGKFRVSSENPGKDPVIRHLLEQHSGDRVLIIGQYLDQLRRLAEDLGAPLITGKTPTSDREELYSAFRTGEVETLIVSKVGNFAIDLPDANVAIQISGTFGSRQEEAQRMGRILRPKSDGSMAHFYSVVTLGSRDQEFSEKRQLFLTEQGYSYEIIEAQHLGLSGDAAGVTS